MPSDFPPEWASDWGQDEIGLWVGFTYAGVRQGFRWINPGTFMMGSPLDEPERFAEETLHQVTLTVGYWLAETACTQALWQAVTGDNPSRFEGADRPVEEVSWSKVNVFIDRLNQVDVGLQLCLPTEAQWEYACRAGTLGPFSFGDNISTEQVNYDGDLPYAGGKKGQYRAETVMVKSLPANAWGLYEMHGNVREWCSDRFGEYPQEDVDDPTGPSEGNLRVLRGGGWFSRAQLARSAFRNATSPGYRGAFIGFRLARGQ